VEKNIMSVDPVADTIQPKPVESRHRNSRETERKQEDRSREIRQEESRRTEKSYKLRDEEIRRQEEIEKEIAAEREKGQYIDEVV
jgi:hypothetical protein